MCGTRSRWKDVDDGAGIWTYEYAGVGNGELLGQKNPNDQYLYRYGYGRTNGLGKPIIEQVRHAGSRAYLEHDASGTPIIIRSDTGNIDDQSLYIYDNLGSPTALVTQNNTTNDSWEYDPYGVSEVESTNGSVAADYTPFGFTGGLNDRVTGWTLNGARYYDPTEGRWTQMDTLDAPLDPSNANRYAYAANNPSNYIDPTGTLIDYIEGAGILGDLIGVGEAVNSYARGDTYNGSVKVASLVIGGVVSGVCTGLTTAATGGWRVVAAGGCLAAGTAASYGFESLASR
ncbi:RHS repeat-associated core domain-containing protein [Cellulomonas sp. NPDC058312]|uniref:RHS repeat-associated core domain-containing protein n=1 Tax=Cellulomonas sp. NPDC058312 TaxID=3346441 RepID=UPI0036EB0D77